jgi:transposase-like protein
MIEQTLNRETASVAGHGAHSAADPIDGSKNFADRIKAIIKATGSVSDIARRCGFSEGVVRSWRDGHTDPSRGRCVTMARTLGISLLWLAAGEGPMRLDTDNDFASMGRESTSERSEHRSRQSGAAMTMADDLDAAVNADQLSSALKLLQSNMELAGGKLSLPEDSDLLAELYDILGQSNASGYADLVVTFHQKLADRVKLASRKGALA